jgi:hypothetical protein
LYLVAQHINAQLTKVGTVEEALRSTMLTTMDGRAPAVEPSTPDGAHDTPACILAALIDGLTSPERYSLEERNGELFIALAHRRGRPQPARPAPG